MSRPSKPVVLSESEYVQVKGITKKGTHKSRKIIRARVLLGMHEGKSKGEVMLEVGVDSNFYHRIKRRYFTGGLEMALEERARSGQPKKINERLEAQVTSIACSDVPEGRARWTLSLIQGRLVELNCEVKVSKETIRKVLKKAN